MGLHMKLYINEDRTEGGTVIDRQPSQGSSVDDWPKYESAGCDGWQWPGNDIGLGCNWRFNMPHGKHQIFIEIDPPASGAPVCGEIPYPEPGWPVESTTTTTTSTTTSTSTEASTTADPFNEDFCKLPENAVDYDMSYKRNVINRRGNDAYLLRVRVPKMPEDKAYTGLLAYGKKDCGIKFIEALRDGVVGLHILDQAESYTLDSKYMGQESKHTDIVFQYTHSPCDTDVKCLGAESKDQFDLLITGLDQVDFGDIDMETCIS